jgi:hypothetical protein
MTAEFKRSHRRTRLRLAALLLVIASLVALAAVRARPAGAYTITHEPDRVVAKSERLHANSVRMTLTVTLWSNGNWEFRYEGRNSARIKKTYWADARVWSDMGVSFYFQTGEREIDGTWRSNPSIVRTQRGYNTWLFHNWERVANGYLEAHFHLHAQHGSNGYSNPNCSASQDLINICPD